MRISVFSFGPFDVNTYILWDETSRQAAIVDPGMVSNTELRQIDTFIKDKNLDLCYLINTHLHIDHSIGNGHIVSRYNIPVSASDKDSVLGSNLQAQADRFGMRIQAHPVIIDNQLHEGDILPLGNETLHIIEVPGHSMGSIAIWCPESNFIISGDTLFRRSVGRTDLEGGNSDLLYESISKKLFSFNDDTLVCPGHGPTTTIGEEKRMNPFVRKN